MTFLSLRLLSFLSCLLPIIIVISPANAAVSPQNYQYFCNFVNRGNYTANSAYHTNLNTVLSTLTSNTKLIDYGFYNVSYTDKSVNAIGLCRGDINPSNCRKCLEDSKVNLTQLCPNQKEAIGWYEDEKCMLRYSDRSIFGLNETGPAYFAWNLKNATKVDQFNKVVNDLLNSLKSRAASGDSRLKYATASALGPNNQTIYGLAQCTPDLSGPQCDNCLVQSIAEISHCCDNSIGARIVRPSCNLRYETSSLFYAPSADSPSPSPLSPSPPLSSSSPSPLSPPLSLSSPPPSTLTNTTSSEDKGSASETAVAIVPLLFLLVGSYLFVSI